MMLKARRPKKIAPKQDLSDKALAFAQLALDIFEDKRHVVVEQGRKNADHTAPK